MCQTCTPCNDCKSYRKTLPKGRWGVCAAHASSKGSRSACDGCNTHNKGLAATRDMRGCSGVGRGHGRPTLCNGVPIVPTAARNVVRPDYRESNTLDDSTLAAAAAANAARNVAAAAALAADIRATAEYGE